MSPAGPRWRVAAACLLAAVVASSAGSGRADAKQTTTTFPRVISTAPPTVPGRPLTRAELIRQGDAICRTRTAEFLGLLKAKYKNKAPKGKQLDDVMVTLFIPTLQRQYRDLFALLPEARWEAVWHQLDDAATEGVAQLRENPPRFGQSSANNPMKNVSTALHTFGFTVCG